MTINGVSILLYKVKPEAVFRVAKLAVFDPELQHGRH
jgi:hypothetical protein